MRSAIVLLAVGAVLSCLGGASAVTLAQLQNTVTAQARDIANLRQTIRNLETRITAQGARATGINGRVNVLNTTIISVNQKIKPLLQIQPSLVQVPDLISDFNALQAAVQPLIANRVALLALLTLPANVTSLTTRVTKLESNSKTQNDSLAALQLNVQPLLDAAPNLLSLSGSATSLLGLADNSASLLSLAPKANALLGLLTIG